MPHITLRTFDSFTKREQDVINAALAVRKNAQAPYSHYHVGSAVLAHNNEIYAGCNVERCSYTQTTHAEQNAIDSMVSHAGSAKIEMLVAAAAPEGQEIILSTGKKVIDSIPAYCCGHCRQIIWENCYNDTKVPCILIAHDGTIYSTTIGDLLPFPFGPRELGVSYK